MLSIYIGSRLVAKKRERMHKAQGIFRGLELYRSIANSVRKLALHEEWVSFSFLSCEGVLKFFHGRASDRSITCLGLARWYDDQARKRSKFIRISIRISNRISNRIIRSALPPRKAVDVSYVVVTVLLQTAVVSSIQSNFYSTPHTRIPSPPSSFS